MPEVNNLPPLNRYLTTSNEAGTSVFITDIPNQPPVTSLMGGIQVSNCYSVNQFPVKVTDGQDLQFYDESIQNPPGIVIPTGSALRIVDFPPAYTSPMHRTISVNFNVVIEGEVELILDSGETRLLKRGDSAIQRVINHAWRNLSTTDWARIVAVPLPAEV